MTDEEWKVVPSFPTYLASSAGRIKGPRGWVLKTRFGRGGYLCFCAYRANKHYTALVNRSVCEAFHGPAPSPEHEAAHWDGVRTNNVPSNLRWATSKENHSDKRRHGTWPELSNHPRAQLSEEDVREIRRVYAQRAPHRYIKRGTREALAERFGVKVSLIKDIVANRCWAKV